MNGIVLCNRSLNDQELQAQCGLSVNDLSGSNCQRPQALRAYTPYSMSQQPTALDNVLMMQLAEAGDKTRNLTHLSLSFGGDNTVALAQVMAKLNATAVASAGAATSVYANRVGGFAEAVQSYQDALLRYRSTIKMNGAEKPLAEQNARAAFNKLQRRFQQEMKLTAGPTKARRGLPLTNPQRAINIATSSRSAAKLEVMTAVEASNLVKFSNHARFLGNGLAVIDFGARAGNIHNAYMSGERWERELFIESTSFAVSAGAGAAVVKAGLWLLLIATPVGWVGLVVGGIAVAGAAAGASILSKKVVKNNAGNIYDSIMQWITN